MNNLTKLALLALAGVSMLGLSACGEVQSTAGYQFNEFSVTLKDGQTMKCIGHSGALDCDWRSLK